jgi:hypothetical protein
LDELEARNSFPLSSKGSSSARLPEELVTLLKKLLPRVKPSVGWRDETSPRNLLKTMEQHGTIRFLKHIPADLDHVVRPDAENMRVERGVVQLAERKTVRNDRLASRVTVRQDVRGLEQLAMSQTADAAAQPIGVKNTFAERRLVHPLGGENGDVASLDLVD